MKPSIIVTAWIVVVMLVSTGTAEEPCQYLKSRSSLPQYASGGPYQLDHFHLTKGRTDLREFLWSHWQRHIKGIAEARAGTVDAGTVTVLYVVQPDAQGHWGIDVELYRPVQPPPCSAFHADSLVRVRIRKPNDDNSQTLLYLPDGVVPPEARLPDSQAKEPKYYKIVLMADGKAAGDDI